jgi:hypothetical protein
MTHIYEEYPKGGWHYVVVKDGDGEAKFLHSIQVQKEFFSLTGNYFCYRIIKNRSGPFGGMSVATSRTDDGWYDSSRVVGHIAIPNRVSLCRAFDIMREITGIDFTDNDLLGSFRTKCSAMLFSFRNYQGETITKSQFETYKLLTNLPVLSPNVW